jgi:NADH:ubiquinone oxidoreductase subunit H
MSISLPLIFFILWIRAVLPRLRFDQLLELGWMDILPITIGYLIFLPSYLFTFDLI